MTTNKDTDLREALRRRYADTPQLPTDFNKRMKQRMNARPAASAWWRWVAIAASILLIIGIGVTLMKDRTTQPETMVAENNPQPLPTEEGMETVISNPTEAIAENHEQQKEVIPPSNDRVQKGKATSRRIAHGNATTRHNAPNQQQSVSTEKLNEQNPLQATTADQLSYYIARLEAEMENLDDSVSAARVEQLIAADARLQQLVNRIVSEQVGQAMNEIKKDSTAQYINF